jgi:ABC-2 type transport system ATP-binding protein
MKVALAPGMAGQGSEEMGASAALPAEPALAVRDVSHQFGERQALKSVSLEVRRGAFVALLGPNGAGKTTLFSVVTRLYHNSSGTIAVFGHELRREPSRALAELGVVFQSRTLDSDLSVRQNLLYHAALHGIPAARARERIAALLARVGLADRADDKVRTLSGGQARRVEIARALVHSPRLLLLDEPSVGLDPASRAAVGTIVRSLVAEDGLSVLWATHLFDEIAPEDGVVILHRGAVVASGAARDIAGGADTLEARFRALTEAGAS